MVVVVEEVELFNHSKTAHNKRREEKGCEDNRVSRGEEMEGDLG